MKKSVAQKANDAKLAELILYLSKRSEGDVFFGAVKLNKLLFYIDFLAYLHLGKSVTGHKYRKLEHGPAPTKFVQIRRRLIQNKALAVQRMPVYGKEQQKHLALRQPNTALFGGEEIALAEQVLQGCSTHSASEISDLSHQFIGWKLAKLGETIPYSVALVGTREPSESEKSHARTLIPAARKCLTNATPQNRHSRAGI